MAGLYTNPKALNTSLEEVYIVEVRDSWVTPETLALPYSWPLVFPKVTRGMPLGPPKMNIINLQIWKNTIWLFNWFCLFPILPSSDFRIYLDFSFSGKRLSKILLVHKHLLHSSYASLNLSFVNLHHDWYRCLVQVYVGWRQNCPVGDVDMLWCKYLTVEQLKWSIGIVDMFSNLRMLLVISLSWYDNWLALDHIFPMYALSPLICI